MTVKEFQSLATRIEQLDPRIDWLTILGASASGRRSKDAFGLGLLRLRPLLNHAVEGLVFSTKLIPMPPRECAPIVTEVMREMNGIMLLPTGSQLISESGKIHFLTVTLREPSGFTDLKLATMVDMNLVLGEVIVRSLIAIHRGQISSSAAMQRFSGAFQEFMDELPSEVLKDYYARVEVLRATSSTLRTVADSIEKCERSGAD